MEAVNEDQLLLLDRDGGSEWSLQRVGRWLQVKGWIHPDVASAQAVSVTLAALHDRALGCRFAIDEDNNLCMLADLFPHDQSGEAVGAAISQMQWVLDSTEALFRKVQETGHAADERSMTKHSRMTPLQQRTEAAFHPMRTAGMRDFVNPGT